MKNRQNNKKTNSFLLINTEEESVFSLLHSDSADTDSAVSEQAEFQSVFYMLRLYELQDEVREETENMWCDQNISEKYISWCLCDVHWPSVSVRLPDSTAVIHVFRFPLLRWALPPLPVSQHALQQQTVSAGAADVGGKCVSGNREMDQTIPAAAARTILHVWCLQRPHYQYIYLQYFVLFLNISPLFSYFVLRITFIVVFCILKYFCLIVCLL